MIEELPDDIDNDELDDVEPVGDEAQLYEHFRVVVDKGQEMMRVDKYLFDRLTNSSRNRIQKAADAREQMPIRFWKIPCRCRLRDGERQGCEKQL